MNEEITECPDCHAEKYLGKDFIKQTWAKLHKDQVTGEVHELILLTCKGCGHEFRKKVVKQVTNKPQ